MKKLLLVLALICTSAPAFADIAGPVCEYPGQWNVTVLVLEDGNTGPEYPPPPADPVVATYNLGLFDCRDDATLLAEDIIEHGLLIDDRAFKAYPAARVVRVIVTLDGRTPPPEGVSKLSSRQIKRLGLRSSDKTPPAAPSRP